MEQNSELQQVLKSLEESSRKQVRYARLQFIFSLLAAVCCVFILIAVVKYIPQLQALTTQIQDMATQLQGLATHAENVMTNLETVTDALASADLEAMVDNVNSLVVSSQDGVKQTMEKLNTINLDALNQAIANLSAVVEPLAKFFKVFK